MPDPKLKYIQTIKREEMPHVPLRMSASQFVGMAIGLMHGGTSLVNDESRPTPERYLDVGLGLRVHMPLEMYTQIVGIVGANCTAWEIRAAVTERRWKS